MMLLIKKWYIALLIIFSPLIAQDINGKVVFAYTDKEEAESFALKRVYLTFSKVISEELSVKIQTDVDSESSPQNIYLKNERFLAFSPGRKRGGIGNVAACTTIRSNR